MRMTRLALVCIILITFFGTFSFAETPTTPHFPEVFLGKCYLKNPNGTNCTQVYEAFSAAAMQDNTVVTYADYVPFFELADFSTQKSSILFWSGSMAFALAVSSNDERFVTVEETSTGYILNNLSWCGLPNQDPPQYDYTSLCYYPSSPTYYGLQGVWSEASTLFAQGASGDIVILLQPASIGGNPPVYQAYRNTSIFARVEMPAMIPGQIDSVTVLLLKNTTQAPEEVCGKGTLALLAGQMREKFGFEPKCIDDPALVYNILCPAHTTSAQCLAATLVYTDYINQELDYKLWAYVTTATSGVLVLVALALLVRNATRKGYESINTMKRRSYHD